MELFQLKIISAVLTFGMVIIFALPAFMLIGSVGGRLLKKADALSRGIFLGVGLCHLLPDANMHFTEAMGHAHTPLIELTCLGSILILLMLEKTSHFLLHNDNAPHAMLPLLLTLMLTVHATIEGIALGINMTYLGIIYLLMAILAHKGAAAFALSIQIKESEMPRSLQLSAILLFALATPLGIFTGLMFESSVHGAHASYAEAIFNAIAAGTFIYVALLHETHEKGSLTLCNKEVNSALYFVVGSMLMALLTILFPHVHHMH